MSKNVCIIHYNTPLLTSCLVRSINKIMSGVKIFIFDNSDSKPFVNVFDNVTVFDNTHGQIIDFERVLGQYPNRFKSRGAINNFGSAKHSMSVQKCIELLDEEFVLFDSDVLLKKDISHLWNNSFVWIGGVEAWRNRSLKNCPKKTRVCPFILYLNVPKMKELGISFFDDKHMLGFNINQKCEEYETGVWLYEKTPEKYRKIFEPSKYIAHFRAGSWLEDAKTKQNYNQIDPHKWLIKNKKYWASAGDMSLDKLSVKHTETEMTFKFSDFFDHIYCLHYLPYKDRLPALKSELKRVGIDETADYFSWVYDYPSTLLDSVFEDERLNMDVSLRSSSRKYIKKVSLKHYEIAKEAYEHGYERILVLEDDIRFHKDLGYIGKLLMNIPDTDVVLFDKMTSSSPSDVIKYKELVRNMTGNELYCNMSGIFFIFASCYSLNQNGMQHIISTQEDKLLPPDTPFNDSAITGSFAVINMAIQDPDLKTRKTESYDKIGLDMSQYAVYKTDHKTERKTIVAKPKVVGTGTSITKIKRTALKNPTIQKKRVVRPRTVDTIRKPTIAKKNSSENIHPKKFNKYAKTHNQLYDVM